MRTAATRATGVRFAHRPPVAPSFNGRTGAFEASEQRSIRWGAANPEERKDGGHDQVNDGALPPSGRARIISHAGRFVKPLDLVALDSGLPLC